MREITEYIQQQRTARLFQLYCFYFKTVEYYTPATEEAYRSKQPLSLLIFRAMSDAVIEEGQILELGRDMG